MKNTLLIQRLLGIIAISVCFLYNYMPDNDGTYIVIMIPVGLALLFSQKPVKEWEFDD